MREYKIVVHQEGNEIWGEYEDKDLGNVFSEGNSLDDLEIKMKEALSCAYSAAYGINKNPSDFIMFMVK